jgi:hypothetical protein
MNNCLHFKTIHDESQVVKCTLSLQCSPCRFRCIEKLPDEILKFVLKCSGNQVHMAGKKIYPYTHDSFEPKYRQPKTTDMKP